MWILMIEACVAFFLLVFIVWWTMYAPKPKPRDEDKPADQQRDGHNDTTSP